MTASLDEVIETPDIPLLQVIDPDGELVADDPELAPELYQELYRKMVLARTHDYPLAGILRLASRRPGEHFD